MENSVEKEGANSTGRITATEFLSVSVTFIRPKRKTPAFWARCLPEGRECVKQIATKQVVSLLRNLKCVRPRLYTSAPNASSLPMLLTFY